MASVLSNWLGRYIDREIELAVTWMQTEREQRTRINDTQDLEELYEDDGSNLRIKCFSKSSPLQIVKFTHVDDDDPVEAILSDGYTSIKTRFSSSVVETFLSQHKRSITHQTEGGLVKITGYEIVLSLYGSGNEDRISLLVTALEYEGYAGMRLLGKPQAVQDRPKLQKCLLRLLGVKVEEDSAAEDDDLHSQADILSQGEPETVEDESMMTQTQFGTQIVGIQPPRQLSSARVLGGVNLAPPQPGRIKHGISHDPRPLQETAGNAALLNLLKDNKPKQSIPPAPRTVGLELLRDDENLISGEREKHSQSASSDEVVAEGSNSDDDSPLVSSANNEGVVEHVSCLRSNTEIAQSHVHKTTITTPEPIEKDNAAEAQLLKSVSITEDIPPSFQRVVPMSSGESTTQHVVPSTEKDPPAEARPQKRSDPAMNGGLWKIAPPLTRATCSIPDNQRKLLNKPTSWFPPSVGSRFFPNIPLEILSSLNKKIERRALHTDNSQTGRESPDDGNQSEADDPEFLPSSSRAENTDIEAPSTQEIPWSSSPVRPVNRQMELPPDSSLPEQSPQPYKPQSPMSKQAHGEQELSSLDSMNLDEPLPIAQDGAKGSSAFDVPVEASRQKSPQIPSSPPPLPAKANDTEMKDLDDDDSDLEMEAPKAYTQVDEQSDTTKRTRPEDEIFLHVKALSKLKERLLEKTAAGHPTSSTRLATVGHGSDRTSSSAPITPCSFGASQRGHQAPLRRTRALDGAADSSHDMSDLDDAVQRQIESEIATQSQPRRITLSAARSHQRKSSASSDASIGASHRGSSPLEQSSAILGSALAKRGASSSPVSDSHKKLKQFQSNYGFSQESPVSQDPATRIRQERRRFIEDLRQKGKASSSRPGSSASDRSGILDPPDIEYDLPPFDHAQGVEIDVRTNNSQSPAVSGMEIIHNERPSIAITNHEAKIPTNASTTIKRKAADISRPEEQGKSNSSNMYIPPTIHASRTGTPSDDPSKKERNQPPSRPGEHRDPLPGDQKPDDDDLFIKFIRAYPEYTGDRKHFLGLCRMIDKLKTAGTMLPKFLWDDFIMRHKVEYKTYIDRCGDEGSDPVPYQRFYSEEINEPKYQKRIIDQALLRRMLDQEDGPPSRDVRNPRGKRKAKSRSRKYRPEVDSYRSKIDSYQPDSIPRFNQRALSERLQPGLESRGGGPKDIDSDGTRSSISAQPKVRQPPATHLLPKKHAQSTDQSFTKVPPTGPKGKISIRAPAVPIRVAQAPPPSSAAHTNETTNPASAASRKVSDTTTQALPKTALQSGKKRNSTPLNSAPAAKKPAVENSFTIFKQRYNKPRPPGRDTPGPT